MDVLSKDDVIDDIINSKPVVIFQFGSKLCNPCIALKQKLQLVFKDNERVNHVYIDIEENKETAATYDVFTVPTIIVFVNSKLTIREAGYFSLEDIILRIERYLSLI